MANRLELRFRKAVGKLIPKDTTLLVAVSGGGDSIALLHLLVNVSAGYPLNLVVGHLDHGLRRGSAADRRFVRETGAGLGLEVLSDRRPVGPLRRKSESPEEAARRVRREFLLEAMDQAGALLVATGHTVDDQAETVLMRLLRGAGPRALAGIRDSGPGPFVRPLLRFGREELRAWLAERSIRFREDPTNRNLRYDRNRLRLKVLPFLEDNVNPASASHLVQAAGLIRDDAEYLDEVAMLRYQSIRKPGPEENETVRLAPGKLARLPEVLSRRVTILALRDAGVTERRISGRLIQAVLDLDEGGSGRRIHLPGGCLGIRTRKELTLSRDKVARK
jgi:tRNA(Ile)-lysidine synthase